MPNIAFLSTNLKRRVCQVIWLKRKKYFVISKNSSASFEVRWRATIRIKAGNVNRTVWSTVFYAIFCWYWSQKKYSAFVTHVLFRMINEDSYLTTEKYLKFYNKLKLLDYYDPTEASLIPNNIKKCMSRNKSFRMIEK